MAHLLANEFTTFSLNEDEETQGSVLTIDQQQVIHNDLAISAAEKLALEPDTQDYSKYLQQEAYLRGQIDAYRFLLERSLALQEVTPNDL